MLQVYQFSIPFFQPFKTAMVTLSHRKGLLLALQYEDIIAYGEVSPLPGFSKESLTEVTAVLVANKQLLEQAIQHKEEEQILRILWDIHRFPSLSFGLDTLISDLRSKKESNSIHQHLFDSVVAETKANTAIGLGSEYEMIRKTQLAIEEGFSTIKMKVGANIDEEYKALSLIRREFPSVKLRIDANQAWSSDEAITNLNKIESLGIEYCEQPVIAHDIDALKRVKKATTIQIAADEGVRDTQSAIQLLEGDFCDLLILKPALFGRFRDLKVTKDQADTHGKGVVFTTSFDGIVGRTMTANLASGLGTGNYAHGLATGAFLDEGVFSEMEIQDGKYMFPTKVGLGRSLDFSRLQQII